MNDRLLLVRQFVHRRTDPIVALDALQQLKDDLSKFQQETGINDDRIA